jgi:molecular chaperone DnaK (HSP70)
VARGAQDNQGKILLQVISPSIQDALDRANLNQQNMRSVVTVPPSAVEEKNDPRNPWKNLTEDKVWKTAERIPEPVAAVWGAQIHGDLPLHDMNTPILVVDIGANATSLTIVEKDVVLANVTMDFGAQKYVEAICEHIIETQPKLGNIRNDGMAWQRLRYAAQTAVQELNTNTQATLNVPYIGMDLQTKEPIHLDVRVPRQLIEQKVSDHIITDLILKHEDTSGHSFLSPHVPVNNMSSLWMSIMTQLLTDINKLPQALGHVLLVGGGAKHAMIENSVKECFGFFRTKVAIPALSTRSELVALGASSILPHYEYDFESGLIRNEEEVGGEESDKTESS